jgi:hypothetical protein
MAIWTGGRRVNAPDSSISKLEVVADRTGTVHLAWSDGEKGSYTIYRMTDPRDLGRAEAHVVKGNAWVDDERDASKVVFYRVE